MHDIKSRSLLVLADNWGGVHISQKCQKTSKQQGSLHLSKVNQLRQTEGLSVHGASSTKVAGCREEGEIKAA